MPQSLVRIAVFALLNLAPAVAVAGHPAHPAPARPTALPTLVAELPETFDHPVIVTGPMQTGRGPGVKGFGADANDFVGDQPDFVLKVARDQEHVVWFTAGHRGKIRAMRAQDYLASGRRGGTAPGALAAGDWVVWVSGPEQMTSDWSVAIAAPTAKGDPFQRFGAPAADAPIADRELGVYLPFIDHASFYGLTVNSASAAFAHQLFTTLPKEFFVFAQVPIRTTVHESEPLLLFSTPTLTSSNTQALTADGLLVNVKLTELTATPEAIEVAAAPIKLTFTHAKDLSSRWMDEEFLGLATADEATSYRAKKKAASQCYEQAWDKLDPSHNSGGYVVVTHKGGAVTTEENLADRNERSAVATCKLAAFEAGRDKLEQTVLGRFETARKAWPHEVATYLAAQFPGVAVH